MLFFFTQGWEYWHPAHIGRKVFQCNRTRAICVILSATTPSSCTVKFRFQHRIPSHCVAFCYGWCRFTVVNSLGMSQCGVRNTKLVVNVRLSSVICWKWNWIKTQNADNFEVRRHSRAVSERSIVNWHNFWNTHIWQGFRFLLTLLVDKSSSSVRHRRIWWVTGKEEDKNNKSWLKNVHSQHTQQFCIKRFDTL